MWNLEKHIPTTNRRIHTHTSIDKTSTMEDNVRCLEMLPLHGSEYFIFAYTLLFTSFCFFFEFFWYLVRSNFRVEFKFFSSTSTTSSYFFLVRSFVRSLAGFDCMLKVEVSRYFSVYWSLSPRSDRSVDCKCAESKRALFFYRHTNLFSVHKDIIHSGQW